MTNTRNHEVDKALKDHDKAISDLQATLAALLQQQEKILKAMFEDAMEELASLVQTGDLQDYNSAFDRLLNRVTISEPYAVSLYIKGLKPELKGPVKMVKPRTLHEAYGLARLQDINNRNLLNQPKDVNEGSPQGQNGNDYVKGSGTQLKDIPNVAYKLSKRKADETLQSLHSVLFSKRAKVNTLKKNVGMFSGFVWADDEQEKQRLKVKEKLDKFTKEKLFDFCDILNLQIHKSSLKKEEVSSKLLEFLQSPHATTEVLLAEQEQKQSGEKRKRSSKVIYVDDDEGSESEDDESNDEDEGSSSKKSKEEKNSLKVETKSSAKKDSAKDQGKTNKKAKAEPTNEDMRAVIISTGIYKEVDKHTATLLDVMKQLGTHFGQDLLHRVAEVTYILIDVVNNMSGDEAKSSAKKDSAKDQGKTNNKAKAEPTNEDMRAVIISTGIYKEVENNTATMLDVMNQLGIHFGQNLKHRVAEVGEIIIDVIKRSRRW